MAKKIKEDKEMTEKEVNEYLDFMYNPKNSYNCDKCPENSGFDGWEGKLPCGQQNCWVDCHCRNDEDY